MTIYHYYLAKWKRLLNLQEWKIVLRPYCNIEETNGNVATTEWDEVHKCAIIRFSDPTQYGKRILPLNIEKTVIHELLHIKFALFDGYGEFQDRYLHQVIEEFAMILKKGMGDDK